MSRKRNICDVSATYMVVALHMQRTCVAAVLTARVRHHDVNLTACVRHRATTHTCTHTGACPCCIMFLPLTMHAPSIFPSSLPHMYTHPALHDTACVPHVHGRRHAWVKIQRFMSVALLARSPGARCNFLSWSPCRAVRQTTHRTAAVGRTTVGKIAAAAVAGNLMLDTECTAA